MKTYLLTFVTLSLLFFTACKKDPTYVYELQDENLYFSSLDKNKQKSSEQYISILYSNLFSSSIPADQLTDMAEVRRSNGDKQMVDELLLNNFVNTDGIDIPTNATMRADIDAFIEATYVRFFLRFPNAYEKFELRNTIEEDEGMTPELIYQAFALSNEYKFY